MLKKLADRCYFTYLDRIAGKEMQRERELVDELLAFGPGDSTFVVEDERSYPGHSDFVESGYWETMLKRYFIAGKKYCTNKAVLDTCCGLGWGSRIVAQYAENVLAFDQDRSVVDFCVNTWKKPNLEWRDGDALDLSFLANQKFDVALGMETIEHFSYEEGIKYVSNVSSVLYEGGVFIGTSCFPYQKSVAELHCAKNLYHRHIFTFSELDEILGQYFSKHLILKNWLFIAKK